MAGTTRVLWVLCAGEYALPRPVPRVGESPGRPPGHSYVLLRRMTRSIVQVAGSGPEPTIRMVSRSHISK